MKPTYEIESETSYSVGASPKLRGRASPFAVDIFRPRVGDSGLRVSDDLRTIALQVVGPRVRRLLSDGTINMSWPDVEEVRRRWQATERAVVALPRRIDAQTFSRYQAVLGAWQQYLSAWGY